MGKSETPVGFVDHRQAVPVDDDGASELNAAPAPSHGGTARRRVGSLVAGGILGVFAVVLLVGGGWALWKDRVDRDADGFVSIGSTDLRTEAYAIVGDFRGDGPSWLWGSTVMGDERVRATSLSDRSLFVGVAPTDDVLGYLGGAGYAAIDSFEVRADTTHAGGAPSGPPSAESMWAVSTQGEGQQTLLWTPRSGDWSIVLMNADADAGVAVHGDASAELPILPWVAVGLLVAAGTSGVIGGWLLVRGIRRPNPPAPSEPDESQGRTTGRAAVEVPS